MEKLLIAFCSAPSVSAAQRLAEQILQARLAACVNIIPGIQSHYWWQGKIEQANEALMMIKTAQECVSQLKDVVSAHHDYETPELIFVPVTEGLDRYIDWVQKETRHVAGS